LTHRRPPARAPYRRLPATATHASHRIHSVRHRDRRLRHCLGRAETRRRTTPRSRRSAHPSADAAAFPLRRGTGAVAGGARGRRSDRPTVARRARRPALDMSGVPPFELRAYECVSAIGRGAMLAYGEVAARLGEPGAARAVGAQQESVRTGRAMPTRARGGRANRRTLRARWGLRRNCGCCGSRGAGPGEGSFDLQRCAAHLGSSTRTPTSVPGR